MNAKHIGIGIASTFIVALLMAPAATATTTCSKGTVTGTSTNCNSTRTINCPGPQQCWVGSYCKVTGTGLLGCNGAWGATCGPVVNGCTAYGGIYFPPGWSGSITNICTASGYGTGVVITCN
jgi:hypothetical protein